MPTVSSSQKLISTAKYIRRLLRELIGELIAYYFSTYPILRILGTIRRIRRHLRILWFGRSRGRPSVPEPIIDLIIDMKRSNLNWGAKRISQELALLGLTVSKETVRKILYKLGFCPPKLKFSPPTWGALLSSYKNVFAMDFTCVLDLFGNQIFILVILDHLKRELILLNATLAPNREWILQQIRNFHLEYDVPDAMIIDRDGIYGHWLRQHLRSHFFIEPLRTPIKSPWWNGRVERFHRTLKEELVYRLGSLNIDQLRKNLSAYRFEYNERRPHQALDGRPPVNIKAQNLIPLNQIKDHRKTRSVNGLITRFELVA